MQEPSGDVSLAPQGIQYPNILGGRFRHGISVEHRMELHRMAVDVIVGVIQYDYENGHPPFDV